MLLVDRSGPVATVTLNRPEAMNALSHLFVIYGFALKAEGVTDDAMEASLKHCIDQDIKAIRGMRDAQEA